MNGMVGTPAPAASDDEAHVARLLMETAESPQDPLPLTQLGALFARGGRLTEAQSVFQRALMLDPENLNALWGLSDIAQVLGDTALALDAQRRAIAIAPVVAVDSSVYSGVPHDRQISVLMLCVPGTFQANTPLEFIADGATVKLYKWYLTGRGVPEAMPDYDVVFTAIGHDPHSAHVLEEAQAFIDAQSRPVINEPRLVQYLSRDLLAERFAASEHIYIAPVEKITKSDLGARPITQRVLARPISSQAGEGLALLRSNAERDAYLASISDAEALYLAPFIDYRSADGYYRKYRVLFIDGEAYPVHLAISPRWMVHYYNAPMAEHRWMRNEEESFLADLYSVFDGPRGEAIREIAEALPFGYFAIDCGIDPEGRVMLFEADTAMLVHIQDSETLFPYKRRFMERIVEAVSVMFGRRSVESGIPLPLSGLDNDLDLGYDGASTLPGSFRPDAAAPAFA